MANIVIYDGICNLCNGTVKFVSQHDRHGRFSFIALQSDEGRAMLMKNRQKDIDSDTVVLVSDGRYYFRSTAVLQIFRLLGGFWKILFAFIIIPPFIRDFIYRLVARNRYRLFGTREYCEI